MQQYKIKLKQKIILEQSQIVTLQKNKLPIAWNPRWSVVFECLQQLECSQLYLHSKAKKEQTCNILPVLAQISFPNLKQLTIYNMNIKSIEILPKILLPNLATLNLRNNAICSLRSLRKIILPKLTTINLQFNKIVDFKYIDEINFRPERNNFILLNKVYCLGEPQAKLMSILESIPPNEVFKLDERVLISYGALTFCSKKYVFRFVSKRKARYLLIY